MYGKTSKFCRMCCRDILGLLCAFQRALSYDPDFWFCTHSWCNNNCQPAFQTLTQFWPLYQVQSWNPVSVSVERSSLFPLMFWPLMFRLQMCWPHNQTSNLISFARVCFVFDLNQPPFQYGWRILLGFLELFPWSFHQVPFSWSSSAKARKLSNSSWKTFASPR